MLFDTHAHTIKGVTLAGHSVYISVYGGDNTDIARAIYSKIDGGVGTQGNTMLTYNPASDNIADQPDAGKLFPGRRKF